MAERPEALLEALRVLEEDQRKGTDQKRRAFGRTPLRGEAELLAIDQTRPVPPIPIQLRDIGWGGLGFICQSRLEENSQWRALFLQRSQQIAHQTLAVRYCVRVAGELWLVGAQVCVDVGVVELLGADRRQMDA